MNGLAAAVSDLLTELFQGRVPLAVRAWDGSEAGPPGGIALDLRRPEALRHVLRAPGELGLARAYVTGALDVDGDLEVALGTVMAALAGGRPRVTPRVASRVLRLLAASGVLGGRAPIPSCEAHPKGKRHSPGRDAEVVRHHYDVSNDFYSLLLDPSMAYSCGYWISDSPGYGLADAQRDKLDLICRKLDLGPGTRLLDIGCGWGSLAVHAAGRYGTAVTAVTVSRAQHDFATGRVAREGVSDRVDVRLCDYREILGRADGSYDAVAAIEMGEHVGAERYPAFMTGLRSSLRNGGRMLLQVMSRSGRHPGGGPFIERYIAPDMHMRPLHETLAAISQAGFEVRDVHALREHYARTIRAWRARIEHHWDEVVGMMGEEQARVWRLYLAGGALSFEQGRMGVDQIVAVRAARDGTSGMAPTRAGWEPDRRAPDLEPVAGGR